MKIESKEKLAKLLAVEDLDVQHQQVETAYFDIKNRCLILPIWKDMPDHLYDLLVGHEVGHALFTPTNLERVQKAYKKSSKSCVNIIEDARIEKLVKNRYPGLRKPFFSGYKHLVEKDFFGLSKRPPFDEMNILDKINLYFKIPTSVDISFNDVEEEFIKRIEKAKSFKDVEKLSEEIYAYAKLQKEDEDMEDVQGTNEDESSTLKSDEKIEGEEVETSEAEDGDEGQEGNEDGKSGDDVKPDEKDEAEGEGDESPIDEEQEAFNNYMDQSDDVKPDEKDEAEIKGDESPMDEVRSNTFDHFQERLKGLVEKNVTNQYFNIPNSVNLNVGVVDYKVVHKNIDEFYRKMDINSNIWHNYTEGQFEALKKYVYEEGHKTLNKIKKDSVKTVNHIAMEFERKKAADVYKKVLVSKTGVLDTNKLFSAKYNDDVFKRNLTIPEGKNHGLVMIIDWSGSMANNIFGCIKQVIELTLFCKKVNIPFEVYSFMERDPFAGYDKNGQAEKPTPTTFNYRHRDFVIDSRVCLRNYMSSRMNAKDYNRGLLNLCILANRNNHGANHHRGYYPVPKDDELKSTPLNGAILLSEHVIRKFKKDNHLECVHAIWLTDGEASGGGYYFDATKPEGQEIGRNEMIKDQCNIYLKDTKMKKNYLIGTGGYYGRGAGTTPACLDIVKNRLGINQIGFFIIDRFSASNLWRYVPRRTSPDFAENERHYKEFISKAKKDGWFVKTEAGYDEYYVIRGDNLSKEIADLDVKPEMTPRKMAINFMRKNNAFKVNRVILSRFIDLITAKTTT